MSHHKRVARPSVTPDAAAAVVTAELSTRAETLGTRCEIRLGDGAECLPSLGSRADNCGSSREAGA